MRRQLKTPNTCMPRQLLQQSTFLIDVPPKASNARRRAKHGVDTSPESLTSKYLGVSCSLIIESDTKYILDVDLKGVLRRRLQS